MFNFIFFEKIQLTFLMKVNRFFASSTRSFNCALSVSKGSLKSETNLFEGSLSKTNPSGVELKQSYTIKKLREHIKHLKYDNDSLRKTIKESKLKAMDTKEVFIQYDHWPTV